MRSNACLVASLALALAVPSSQSRAGDGAPLRVTLDVDRLGQLVHQPTLLSELPAPQSVGVERITAFEENWHFLYVEGTAGGDADATAALRRRIFVLAPLTVVVDDQLRSADQAVAWQVELPDADATRVQVRRLLPAPQSPSEPLELAGPRDGRLERVVHVLDWPSEPDDEPSQADVQLDDDGLLRLTLTQRTLLGGQRTATLWLPAGARAGRVAISDEAGISDLPARLLPAGILAPGSAALEQRAGWDIAYQTEGLATWDIGQASPKLKEAVESGAIRPGRVVELGCGTGSDAIYLASQGFDVTAIDIAPTALQLAEEQARQAGVDVRWLLADVLRPPELGPFDVVYDRGCYHDIRQHDAAGYVAAVRQLVAPGGHVLILAGSADNDTFWEFHGPPRVKQDEIRHDFADGFTLLWLREFRFAPTPPATQGPLAWSILLERTAE